MKLHRMAKAMRQWLDQPKDKELAPAELVGLLDAEWLYRENRKLASRLRNAKLKQACIEDINYSHARRLAKTVVLELASSRWVQVQQNIILTGPTGVGKSYLACALGQKACRDGFSVVYRRASRLSTRSPRPTETARIRTCCGGWPRPRSSFLDDFGIEPLTATQRKELLELLDDRYKVSSTIVTSQLEPKDWHAVIGDATLADTICDRLVHNAHRLRLDGGSVRKAEGLTGGTKPAK